MKKIYLTEEEEVLPGDPVIYLKSKGSPQSKRLVGRDGKIEEVLTDFFTVRFEGEPLLVLLSRRELGRHPQPLPEDTIDCPCGEDCYSDDAEFNYGAGDPP